MSRWLTIDLCDSWASCSINEVFWQDVSLRQTSQRQAFCDAWKALKFVFIPGSTRKRTGRAHDKPPRSLLGWGGGNSLPIFQPIDAFGFSARRLKRDFPPDFCLPPSLRLLDPFLPSTAHTENRNRKYNSNMAAVRIVKPGAILSQPWIEISHRNLARE